MRRVALLTGTVVLTGVLSGCVALGPGHGTASSAPSTPKPGVPTRESANPGLTITYYGFEPASGAIEVAGYVAGAVVADGTCTLFAGLGSVHRESSTTAEPNAGDTQCGTLTIGDVAPGEWSVSLHFASATTGALESESVIVMVPAS